MATTAVPVYSSKIPKLNSKLNPLIFDLHVPPPFSSYSLSLTSTNRFTFGSRSRHSLKLRRRNPTPPAAAMILSQNPVLSDILATVFSGGVALSVLRVWQETAKRQLFDQVKTPPTHFLYLGFFFFLNADLDRIFSS